MTWSSYLYLIHVVGRPRPAQFFSYHSLPVVNHLYYMIQCIVLYTYYNGPTYLKVMFDQFIELSPKSIMGLLRNNAMHY